MAFLCNWSCVHQEKHLCRTSTSNCLMVFLIFSMVWCKDSFNPGSVEHGHSHNWNLFLYFHYFNYSKTTNLIQRSYQHIYKYICWYIYIIVDIYIYIHTYIYIYIYKSMLKLLWETFMICKFHCYLQTHCKQSLTLSENSFKAVNIMT